MAIGDYATTRVDGTFSLTFIVFNSISNQTTQGAGGVVRERRRAPRAGRLLRRRGRRSQHAPLEVFDLSDTHVGVDEYDLATQRNVSHHFNLHAGQWQRVSMPFRSTSPAELDLMARMAGMTLRERWSGWQRDPFTSESTKHVSVWEKQ